MAKPLIVCFCAGLALATLSCENISPDVYSARTAGLPTETYSGVIESARVVTVQNEGQLGTIVGAAAGAIGGAHLGGGDAEHVLGGIAGGIAGGLAGRGVQKAASRKQAMEYVVRTEDGRLHTVVQGAEPPTLPAGQRVYVQLYGPGRARVIPR